MQTTKDKHLTLAIKQFVVIWLHLFRASARAADLGDNGKYWMNFVIVQNRFVLFSCFSQLITSSTKTLQQADINLYTKMRFMCVRYISQLCHVVLRV